MLNATPITDYLEIQLLIPETCIEKRFHFLAFIVHDNKLNLSNLLLLNSSHHSHKYTKTLTFGVSDIFSSKS